MTAIPAIDYTSSVGRVRLLIADTDVNDILFEDAQLTAFLALDGENVKRAAARALDVIAVSEVLVSKVIRTQDLSTDGAKVAAALRAQAQALRVEADDEDGGFFDIIPGPGTSYVPELTEHPVSSWWL